MKTPDEIKTGLICCAQMMNDGQCQKCPYDGERCCADVMMLDALDYIRQLEAAQPKRTGTWLFVGYGKPDAWDCSECDAMVAKKTRYCPGCGAKMDLEETT